jgi:DNA-binding CsgD family transcriptional regulator
VGIVTNARDRGGILTPRQRQVLRLQAYGHTYQEISERLGLSIWTVKNHHKQAVRGLGMALKSGPNDRIRTSLACYILGLLDGGLSPQEVALRLREVSPSSRLDAGSGQSRIQHEEESPFAAD